MKPSASSLNLHIRLWPALTDRVGKSRKLADSLGIIYAGGVFSLRPFFTTVGLRVSDSTICISRTSCHVWSHVKSYMGWKYGSKPWFQACVERTDQAWPWRETQYHEDGIYTVSSPEGSLQSVHPFQTHGKFFVIAETIVCLLSFLHAHH